MSEWIKVKDKEPPLETNLILFDGEEVFCGNFRKTKDKLSVGIQACDGICYGWCEKKEVTHWMPLPKQPY